MRIITATDLKQWADTKSCQNFLPLIIRNLLYNYCSNIFEKRFPIGDSTYFHGFDGEINIDVKNDFLQIGKYVFEMGCDKNIKSKADKDYKKRKENIKNNPKKYPHLNPKEFTYVFVTPRTWNNKDIWKSNKNKENYWKEVLVLDGVDLEFWLEKSINVSLLLAKLMGKSYSESSLELLDVWWENWSNFNEITINEKVVLASREYEKERFLKLLDEKIFSLNSSSNDESLAFIMSVFKSLSDEEYEKYISKTIIVNTLDAFNELIRDNVNLILIINFENNYLNKNTKNKLILLNNPNLNNSIKLRKQFYSEFSDSLYSLGLDKNIVKEYTRKSGANILVLRRVLTGFHNPTWVDENKLLIPLLFIQSWDNSNDCDKKIIEYLYDKPYRDIKRELNRLLYLEDSPLEKIDELWHIRSPFDVLMNISKFIIDDDFDCLKNILLKIFKMEKLDGTKNLSDCSNFLKRGVLQTLILISTFGDNCELNILNAVSWVDDVMEILFSNESITFLKNNVSFLTLLAEISPKVYINFLESKIFNKGYYEYSDEEKSFLTHSFDLLNSLETLVWEKEYFPRIVILISKLALFSQDDKFYPNPNNSLKDIFMPWYPKTFASLEDRLKMLDKLLIEFPDVGWNLLMNLMPSDRQSSMQISGPVYRKSHCNFVSNEELIENYNNLILKVFNFIGEDSIKWVRFLDFYTYIGSEYRIRANKELLSLDKSKNDTLAIRDKIRWILSFSKHDSKNILTKKEWDDLKEVYDYLAPSDIIDQNIWLFNESHPRLITADFLDDEKLVSVRKEVVNLINENLGFDGFIDLAKKCKHPSMLGKYLIKCALNFDNDIINELENDNENIQKFVEGYIFHLTINDNRLLDMIDFHWSKEKLKRFLIYCKSKREIWSLIENYGEDIQRQYWMNSNWQVINNTEDCEFYIKKLINFGNFDNAIISACLNKDIISIDLIYDLLIKANVNQISVYPFYISELLEKISSFITDEKLAHLEIRYYNYLENDNGFPKAVYKLFIEDNSYFVKHVLNSCNKTDYSLSNIDHLTSIFILHDFNMIPGKNNDNTIDYEFLKNWVNHSRECTKKEGCLSLCDSYLGTLFANVEEIEGYFPPIEVCKIIDEINSPDLNESFSVGIFNKRGVFSKRIIEGGNQELELSKKYENYSEKIRVDFPITSNLLKEVSETYGDDSKREDMWARIKDFKYFN